MEHGRMPLPTTRDSTTDVDTAGNKRSYIEACSHAQIGSLLRSSKCEDGQVSSFHLRQVQRRNLQDFPEKVVAMSLTRQAYGDSFGQCPIPPCSVACTVSEKISPCNKVGVLAAIQSTVGSDRTSMEACQASCDTQPIFCNAIRDCRGRRFMLRPMEKTKSYITEIMRHKLSRYV